MAGIREMNEPCYVAGERTCQNECRPWQAYFDIAASCLTVLMKVVVALVRVRSRR
jgi:hypothetical protein